MKGPRLLLAGDPQSSDEGLAILRKGFRPFFVLAGAYAVLIIPLWLGIFGGVVPSSGFLDPIHWHAHEMLFGYTSAVIAGFLLTAASNWTKRVTAIGPALAALSLLWCAGRVATVSPGLSPATIAAIDLAFYPALIIAIGRPVIAAGARRNYVFLGLLLALFAANILVHLDSLGLLTGGRVRGHRLAVDLVVMVILVISGRIIPAFTRNTTGVQSIARTPLADRLTLAGMFLLVVVDAAAPELAFAPWLAGLVGVCALVRTRRWGAQHTRQDPLLWVLHVGYFWVPVGLVLRAAAAWSPVIPESTALHALTAGAIGTLTLGMMSRVSLGHTGRPLHATPILATAFALITACAVIRVVGVIIAGSHYQRVLEASSICWTAAFGIYLVRLGPALFSARPDGRPG